MIGGRDGVLVLVCGIICYGGLFAFVIKSNMGLCMSENTFILDLPRFCATVLMV